MPWRHWLKPLLVGLACVGVGLAPARAATEVDLALVIAVDISYSMDPEEQALQRDGFAQAFRNPAVHDAIRRGMLGRIAVVYMEWAGAFDQRVVVPWSLLDNPETIMSFADKIAGVPLRRAQRTSVAGAIDFGTKLLDESGFEATRRVIDVSGDGPNNQGRLVTLARNDTLAKGITINGLPIMLKRPNPSTMDIDQLDIYFEDCVIGGPGAFVIPIREREQFKEAIKTKLILEIAGRVPKVVPVAASEPRVSCTIGERLWQERWGN